uniref:Uncharacterized protein n=1 Tax=Oryza barthii TaxID=65489 RepID=A0A0D3GW22_9ORYZ
MSAGGDARRRRRRPQRRDASSGVVVSLDQFEPRTPASADKNTHAYGSCGLHGSTVRLAGSLALDGAAVRV